MATDDGWLSRLPHAESRREFLRTSGLSTCGLGILGIGAGFASEEQNPSSGSNTDARVDGTPLDVAIVGGGISGAYAAWRMLDGDGKKGPVLTRMAELQKGRGLRVGLFEASDRIGGRLRSVTMPGVPVRQIELGGMRFLNTQRRVSGLVNYLELKYQPFPVSDPRKTNIYYLRGRRFRDTDWENESLVPYTLDTRERGKSPADLLKEVAEQYAEQHKDKLDQLFNRGFWNLLFQEEKLSNEAYNLIRDAGGYYTLINNWNAAHAVDMLLKDFAPNAQYLALIDGYDKLPNLLAERFKKHGGAILPRHRLCRLDRDQLAGEQMIRLVFDTGTPERFDLRRISERTTYHARHVILAMPRRSIELLHPESFLFESEQFLADLVQVLAQPAFKVFTAYNKPWWEEKVVGEGRSITDLPIRQCYYWHTAKKTADGENSNSVLMASYNDGPAVEFWSGLARTPKYTPRAKVRKEAEAASGVPLPEIDEKLRAPEGMVHEIQRQLIELHGLSRQAVPDPYEAVFQDWTGDPYGGGWHFWKIHARAGEIMPRVQHPVDGANLYICGEAWSTEQGWVEGALETADQVLKTQFGMEDPSWLNPRG
jgi:monoamine oxidase